MSRRLTSVLLFAGATSVLALALVEPALAVSSLGRNVGGEAKSFASNTILPIAAIVGIPLLLRRAFGDGLALLFFAALLLSFVAAGSEWQTISRDLAGSLFG